MNSFIKFTSLGGTIYVLKTEVIAMSEVKNGGLVKTDLWVRHHEHPFKLLEDVEYVRGQITRQC